MSTNPRLGKLRGLRRMATPAGHFNMMAVDQRHQISSFIEKKLGIGADAASFADMVAIKRVLVEALGEHVSAVLLDPNFSFPAALAKLPARTGFLVTLEDHRFEDTPGGRRSHSIRNWSVEKIKRAGGDGVKLLTWFRPDADPDILAHQKTFVESVGDECRRQDIALVLELLVYPFAKSARHNVDYGESSSRQPELVLDSVREFVHPRYGVDLLKLESPLPGATLPARDGGAGHLQAQRRFDAMGAICRDAGMPWVMLSAGVTPEQFMRVMEYAYAAGANGFLAGRAIWWDALQQFPDFGKFAAQLREQGRATLRELDALTLRAGTRWQPDYSTLDSLKSEGEMCAAYT
ncbi:MAG: tagatose 1,6-diphosphate aldolase [Burkholderiales bacterium]|jgi:tagatose 1,6-diphosphate aldolase